MKVVKWLDLHFEECLMVILLVLITVVSLLTAGGCEPQLEVHLHGALNTGLPPEKLVEALIQCVPYTGFPRVLNAVFAAKRVFEERGIA